jgi:hypothetical protein
MSGWSLPQDVIRNIFSYGDVNDIPKRKMVFDQLLFLKKEFLYQKYENSHHLNSAWTNPYIHYLCYEFCLEKNRLKMLMTIPNNKLNLTFEKIYFDPRDPNRIHIPIYDKINNRIVFKVF